jgi:hypothetical protein
MLTVYPVRSDSEVLVELLAPNVVVPTISVASTSETSETLNLDFSTTPIADASVANLIEGTSVSGSRKVV